MAEPKVITPQSVFLPLVDAELNGIRGAIAYALTKQRPLDKRQLTTVMRRLRKAANIIQAALEHKPLPDTTVVSQQSKGMNK